MEKRFEFYEIDQALLRTQPFDHDHPDYNSPVEVYWVYIGGWRPFRGGMVDLLFKGARTEESQATRIVQEVIGRYTGRTPKIEDAKLALYAKGA
jgi:hypothetical protein